MPSSMCLLIRGVAYAVVATCSLSLTVSAQVAAVEANPGGVKYWGTGELVLPATSPQKVRQEAYGCSGCTWRFTGPCAGELGTADLQCEVRDSACSKGQLLRIWVLKPESPWQEWGVSCFTSQGPLFSRVIRQQLRKELVNALPDLRIDCTPRTAVVTNLPLSCRTSTRVKTIIVRSEIAGIAIRISMKSRAIWRHFHRSGTDLRLVGEPVRASTWSSALSQGGEHLISQHVAWQTSVQLDGLTGSMWMPHLAQRAHKWVSAGTLRPVLPPEGQ
jgi:hypothetical protein